LRKDFPISGYTEKYYDENERRVLSKNLEFTQEYKNFLFTNT
jgi:NADH:ubiquinone oxidoreductase subunit C